MDLGQHEIIEVVRSVWETALGLEIEPAEHMERPAGNRGFWTGFIQIAGAWEGVIVCVSSDPLLRRVAAVMFSVPEAALTTEHLHDTLGELTNMIGGNLKALLPGPSFLCLPAVVEGTDYSVRIPTTTSTAEVAFQCGAQPLLVQVLAGAPSAESAHTLECRLFTA